MSLVIRNLSGVLLPIDDLGITLPIGGDFDLRTEDASLVANSDELQTLAGSGALGVLDPIGGSPIIVLSVSDAQLALAVHNDTHFRIVGGRMDDMDDVNMTGVATEGFLQWNGTNFVAVTPAEVATTLNTSGGVDHTTLTNIGSNTHAQIDTHISNSAIHTVDQNLWETITSDSGSATANTTTDALTISGGTGISTAIVGDTLTITATGGTSDELVGVSANDTTPGYLNGKLIVGTGISFTENNDGGNETLTITNTSPNVNQNLWATITADTGNTTANLITDILSIAGGTGISTAIIGDVLTITNDSPNISQNLFLNVSDGTNVAVADSSTDTLTILSGGDLSIVVTPGTDTVTITNDAPNVTQDLWATISSDSGSTVANVSNDTLTVSGGTGISTAIVGDVVTITNSDPNVDQNLWEIILSDSGTMAANITADTMSIVGGTGISTSISGDTLTIVNDSPNTDQNLWETITGDTGSTVANTTTDTLTISGGTGISTTVVGDTITIASTSMDADLASVTLGITSNIAIPTTFTNLLWTITHLENDTATIEHDNTNTDRIQIKETGLYFISYSISFDADSGEETIQGRVLIDDTTVVPGSLRLASEDDEINDLSNAFTADLTSGTYITFQHLATGTGNVLHNSSNFSITRAKGVKGDTGIQGPPGGTPAGVDHDVQFNDNGVFGGESNFQYDNTLNTVFIGGIPQNNMLQIGGSFTGSPMSDTGDATLYIEVETTGSNFEGQRVYFNRGTPGINGYILYHYDGSRPNIRLIDEDDDSPYVSFQVIGNGTLSAPEFDNKFGGRGPLAGATTGFDWDVNGTSIMEADNEFLTIPRGTTGNRPGTAVEGMVRYNTTNDKFEGFENSAWRDFNTMRPTFPIWAEENGPVTVSANNYEYSFGNGAINNTAVPPGIPMGVACTLIAISVSGRNNNGAGTSTVSISIANNGTVVATGGVASGTGTNVEVKNTTQVTPDTVNFVVGDTLQFITATETGTLDDVRVCAWFERTA